ncbi:MAG: patatin-like phospholipase family protein [Cyclobacteriaceae bacterium]|nr:patatin-like phospholipase family protein [Cyclobacteriaceae bacterium]
MSRHPQLIGLIIGFLITQVAFAQKVGLVLSGGAAKGIAHIGVLKALEEHHIPIDYIVGTSMGGIVGGFYAAGYSPEEIEKLVLSDDFLRWIRGLPERGYNYHYYSHDDSPDFVTLNLSLDSALAFQLNTSIASDVSLNFMLQERLAQASAIARENFDSLFVPFRAVAAEVFTQSQVILKSGSLANALRATQTVPFFYTPIRVDGKYLFDGGIYNNFPVDVASREFNPDVIIGSNVSSKIYKEYPATEDEKLIARSLLYMLLDNSDPADLDSLGIYIEPNVSGYTSFDFDKARALIDSGYRQTLRMLPEIKTRTQVLRKPGQVAEARQRFRETEIEMRYGALTFKSFNTKQRRYIRRIFNDRPDKKPLSLNDIKQGYFKLVSETYFNNVYPSIYYDTTASVFRLQLSRRPQKNFRVDFGGVVATRNVSNIYLGLNYYYFNRALSHFYTAFQTGSFYQSVRASARLDFPFFGRFYVQPEVMYNGYDYLESNDLLKKTSPTVLKRFDRQATLNMGWPIDRTIKSSVSFTGFNNEDRYSNYKSFSSTDTLDRLELTGIKTGLTFTSNTLDRKQYASAGSAFSLTFAYFNVTEKYIAGTTADPSIQNSPNRNLQWFQLRLTAQQFYSKGWFRPGYYAEAVFSNQPVFRNYFGTVVNAPAFLPLQDSRTMILENFRAFNYLAFGLRHAIIIKPRTLDWRVDGYLFKPIEYIRQGANQEAVIDSELTKVFLAATTGPVYHSPIGPVSLSLNYYDDAENRLAVMLHVGFLLFNKHTME